MLNSRKQTSSRAPVADSTQIMAAAACASSDSHCIVRASSNVQSLGKGDCSGNKVSAKASSKLLETTRNRERKRFSQLMVRCSSRAPGEQLPSCKPVQMSIQWAVQASEVNAILSYWQHKSALHGAGLSALLGEKAYARRRKSPSRNSNKLSLTIWNLQELIQAHMALYPAIQTAQGMYCPPLVITAADVIPLSPLELTILHRKSCSKLASFCMKTMQLAMTQYREAIGSNTKQAA